LTSRCLSTLLVRPVDAEVLASLDGEPVIFMARRGKGRAVLSAVPLEAALATLTPWATGGPTLTSTTP